MISAAIVVDSTVLSPSVSTMIGVARHAVLHQVRAAHAALGEDRVAARAARGQDARRQFPRVEIERMIQPRAQHRRRPAAILGRAQHQDDVGRLGLIARALLLDPQRQERDVDQQTDRPPARPRSIRPFSCAVF